MSNINLFTHAETFRRIRPQYLNTWLEPARDYLARRGVTLPNPASGESVDYEKLAAVFMEPDTDMPRALMHSASLIHEMANEAGMQALIDGARIERIQLDVGDDPDPADVAVQMYNHDPDVLEELHHLHELDRPRTFLHFVTDREPVPAFREPSDGQLTELEMDLAEWYFQQKKGRCARVWMYRRPHEFWFLLRHGLASRRQEVLTGSVAGMLIIRPGDYDVVVYNEERGELRIHGNGVREVEMLRIKFGKHLFGDPEFFPGGAKFTLAPLMMGRVCLACGDIPELAWVALTEVQVFRGGREWLRQTYQAPDVFTEIEHGRIGLPEAEQLVRASFLVRFKDSKKARTVKISGTNKLGVVRDGDTVVMERFLEARGFVRNREVNEDAAEVVARA